MDIHQKHKNRKFFFLSLFLSAFGYEFVVAVMTLHVYALSSNALDTGIFAALAFVPRLFSSLIGGVADRLGKTRCFSVSAVLAGLLLAVMSMFSDMLWIDLIWLLASVFLTAIVNVRSSLLAEVVEQNQFAAGNSWVLSLLSAARLTGPLLAGFSAMRLAIQPLITVACVLYVAVGVFATGIRIQEKAEDQRPGFFENARKGWQFMLSNPQFRLLSLIAFFWRLSLGLQISLFVVYVKSSLGGNEGQYGLFLTVVGVGSILGSLLGRFVSWKGNSWGKVAAGLCAHYASFAALGFVSRYDWALILSGISYMAFYGTLVGMHASRDRLAPPDIRSSAYGTVTAVLTPAAIASMLLGGLFADRFGASVVLVGAGVLALISLGCILLLNQRIIAMHQEKSESGCRPLQEQL